jgi:uncharacterized protein YjbJ (UPF0337 family)
MNTSIIEGSWKELKGDVKQAWSKLTDDDLGAVKGNVDELIGRIQKTYGYTKEKAQQEFDNFKNKHSNYFRDEREINKGESMAQTFNGQDVNRIKNKAHNMVDMVGTEMSDTANEYLQRAKDIAGKAADRTTDLVKAYPSYTVLGAATVGFIAGAYLARRK